MIDKEKLLKEFRLAVFDMRNLHCDGTYHWDLHIDKNDRVWAIVLGWSNGYEEDYDDDCVDGTYRICAKLAYQPVNSFMQCDYDIDWTMPYDEETGYVDNTEIAIYPDDNLKGVVNWLLNYYFLNYAEE